ncbi:hypothetical protein LP43_2172 [Methylophaga thiooxydans]|uniref:Uncharacterized protein n=1 Tax=Methylophaga thiooxydans TaxID=392484 RepID=A0A0A0BCL5_9GAMM|nr:hypothetical protein [Methylophaga thiooxydans]KGM06298.1 hypothetical protein LP43_2172 [Methylophaga thiooxydans]
MADCPDMTEIPTNKKFTIIVKGCTDEEVMSKLESKLLDIAEEVRREKGSPCEGECNEGDAGDEHPSCTLWVDYNLTMNHIRAARIPGCPNDVGRIGFFMGVVTNAGCNCV